MFDIKSSKASNESTRKLKYIAMTCTVTSSVMIKVKKTTFLEIPTPWVLVKEKVLLPPCSNC